MQENTLCIPIPSVSLEQAVTDIIESIAMEEAAVSNILNSEGEMIQKFKNISRNVQEYVLLNKSINDVMKNTLKLQMLLQSKLEEAEGLLQAIELSDEYNEPEE